MNIIHTYISEDGYGPIYINQNDCPNEWMCKPSDLLHKIGYMFVMFVVVLTTFFIKKTSKLLTLNGHFLPDIKRFLNISQSEVNCFHNYLSDRQQCIRIEDSFSSWCNINISVPQRSISFILPLIFIHSTSNKLQFSYYIKTNDQQIYTQAPLNNLCEAVTKINLDLERISEWGCQFGLQVNS